MPVALGHALIIPNRHFGDYFEGKPRLCAAAHKSLSWQAPDYDGESADVIGRFGRRIPEEKAFSHIAGFACYNDGSIRDWHTHTSQWWLGKNFQCTGGFGPALVTADKIGEDEILTLETIGQVMQHAATNMLIFPFPR